MMAKDVHGFRGGWPIGMPVESPEVRQKTYKIKRPCVAVVTGASDAVTLLCHTCFCTSSLQRIENALHWKKDFILLILEYIKLVKLSH